MVRNIGIGDQVLEEEPVDWTLEKQKKAKLQRTMIGLTALLGGLAVISRVHTIFKLLPAQTVAIMAFWAMLVLRVLWSLVWFPLQPAAAAGAEAAAEDDISEPGTPVVRRRRVRRET
mmetsp:Transcript_15939/g.47934  ORF Transcript_15939/g.47934 Transcript_15939/m.47934 type:complete len:117 (+) Transcript_15939:372-722(+)|eukprot:CAMPEP_0206146708 /NCGR_PEP_ID=MMETSP1473-20131121/31180_1 /ASSEMBLY_ACC=CAM_ASM_001109 /TAXON_ID=1461547 /ORGANISM="Stichococcus sp, Strain RCC1054" /LENGTH=116 /DNA_ID=CAMNT_0053543367 /DNA_START=307 /DNA_END=657 /DNA_ORIENTATION=+